MIEIILQYSLVTRSNVKVPQWKEIKTILSPHKDTIQRIELMGASNRYLSISKEGCIVFWDHHVKSQRLIKITSDTIKPR